jgi:hypothetical protein
MAADNANLKAIISSLNHQDRVQLFNMLSNSLQSGQHVRIIDEVQELKHKTALLTLIASIATQSERAPSKPKTGTSANGINANHATRLLMT